jgi:hypothetical protein
MAIDYRDNDVLLAGMVGVEDAEVLLAWLQDRSDVQADFSACAHVHPANLQVLLAAGVRVAAWPAPGALETALRSVF